VLAYVDECLAHGSPPADIRTQLIALGYSTEDAKLLVMAAQSRRGPISASGPVWGPDDARAAGKRNMIIGGIVCALGLIVTCGSMAASSGSGGGVIIAWGAIVFGAIQFFRGAAQAGAGSN
jgi:hypothetical protein